MADLQQRSFPVMGTTAHVMALGSENRAIDRACHRLEDLERRWSRFLAESELSQLNRSAGVPVVVSPETYRLIADAIDAWRQSGGSFDPTVGTTMVAAGYDRPFDRIDNTDQTDQTDNSTGRPGENQPAPGPVGIVLHPYVNAVELPVGVELDLGGIAKGAAADLVAAQLIDDGATGCCVNIGGDLRVIGAPPRPEGWQIGLACPGSTRAVTIGLVEGAVCTSTILRRRWSTTAGPQHHLRLPATGEPLERGLQSATVVGARGLQAEVLTKVLLAAGPDNAAGVAAEYGVTGLLVDDRGAVRQLPGLAPFVAATLAPVAA